jgi:P-type E1-E2 ATPase
MCKTLSDNFVTFVLAFDMVVMAAWIAILYVVQWEIGVKCRVCFILERMVSVLVASCPCALGLAVPSVVSICLNMAIQGGLLIRKNTVFELLPILKSVCFDKTGTLFTRVKRMLSCSILTKHLEEKTCW